MTSVEGILLIENKHSICPNGQRDRTIVQLILRRETGEKNEFHLEGNSSSNLFVESLFVCLFVDEQFDWSVKWSIREMNSKERLDRSDTTMSNCGDLSVENNTRGVVNESLLIVSNAH